MKSSTSPTAEPPLKTWILTSGRMGDLVQCRAIASGLGGHVEELEVHAGFPYQYLMPYGPMDPRDRAHLSKPLPDMVIASGRRSVPLAREIFKKSQGACKILFMKYPGRDVSSFAYVWTPDHDRRAAEKTISTLTTPHGLSQPALTAHREAPHDMLVELPAPKLAIVLGGNSKHVNYDREMIDAFVASLRDQPHIKSVMITGSRRTPPPLLEATVEATAHLPQYVQTHDQPNIYPDIIAQADAILVTGDSHNMVSEACAAGRAVFVFNPKGNAEKFNEAFAKMALQGLIAFYPTKLMPGHQPPFDATNEIVDTIKKRFGF